jgi:hypothetical protein
LEECKEMASRVMDAKWKVFADILAGERERKSVNNSIAL